MLSKYLWELLKDYHQELNHRLSTTLFFIATEETSHCHTPHKTLQMQTTHTLGFWCTTPDRSAVSSPVDSPAGTARQPTMEIKIKDSRVVLYMMHTCLHWERTPSESEVMDSWATFCMTSYSSFTMSLRPKIACTHTHTHRKRSSENLLSCIQSPDLEQWKGSTVASVVHDVFLHKSQQMSQLLLLHLILGKVPHHHCHGLGGGEEYTAYLYLFYMSWPWATIYMKLKFGVHIHRFNADAG